MRNEQEYHLFQGEPVQHRNGAFTQPPNDQANQVHHYDNERSWTVVSDDRKLSGYMESIGATEKPCAHDGRLFVVDAKQLIEYIAESSGLIVEFRQRRRQQLSEERREALRQRMATMNAKQRGALLTDNEHFSSPESMLEADLVVA